MGWVDDSNAARVINLVPQALKATARKLAADPYTRQLTTTNRATTTVAIGSRGQVNLVTGYDTYQLLMEYFDKGQVYFLPSVTANPYILSGGTYASGYWTFNANPQDGETIAVNGVTFTFESSVVTLAGAGEASMNGDYTYRGQFEGYPVYTLVGDPDPFGDITASNSVFSDGNLWYANSGTYGFYYSSDVAEYPWDVTGWVSNGPTNPVPTFTEGAFTAVQVEIGATLSETISNFITTLNASVNASITVATYTAGEARGTVIGTYNTQGTGGNAFTLANSSLTSVVRSGATFTGGASTAYALAISNYTTYFTDLSRVQFTTTVTLPTGISASTDYYLTDYTIDDETATFGLSSTADGLTPVTISTAGSGVLTMALQDTNDLPLQEVSPQQAPLTQYLDSVFDYFYRQSNVLTLLPIDGNYPTGSVGLAVPFYPLTLSALPDSEECERWFLDKLFELVAGGDAAQDGAQ